MQPLATVLRNTTQNGTQPSESSPDPLDLQRLKPTEVWAKGVERIEQQIAALPDDTGESVRRRGEFALQAARSQLQLARVRDELQALRPDGCWCFGAGGRNARYMPSLDGEPIQVLDEYCACPEGRARNARDAIERSHYASAKRQHQAARLFRNAGVPPRFDASSFATYPISPGSRAAFGAIQAWANTGLESLLIHGPYGTGKTSLGIAALRHRVERDHADALFLTAPGLLDRIRETYEPRRQRGTDEPTEADVLDAVRNTSLLMLDDLGAERPTDWVQEKLFTVINHRHDNLLTTIFTSNLDPEGMAHHLGERIAWRIVEMSEVVKLDGPNLRDR